MTKLGDWAVVTGATDGIGKGFADRLLRTQYFTILSFINIFWSDSSYREICYTTSDQHSVYLNLMLVNSICPLSKCVNNPFLSDLLILSLIIDSISTLLNNLLRSLNTIIFMHFYPIGSSLTFMDEQPLTFK